MLKLHRVLSIDGLARKVHEEWRKAADRSYSPYNMLWERLPAEARLSISRQARIVLSVVQEQFPDCKFIDEYAPPGPGDVRWTDPVAATEAVKYTGAALSGCPGTDAPVK